MKKTKGERYFSIINYMILTVISFLTLYPFLYVLSASLSSPDAVTTGKVLLLPKEVTLEAYKKVLATKGIWIAYGNTFYYTIVGTLVSIFVTVCGAYPLSKKRLRGGKFINFAITLTMWFHVGTIPMYLNLRDLNLLDKRITIIIAFACSTFYVILMRTYFQSIPESIEESARIDGANDLSILSKIVLPLSGPALATIGLYYAVNRWNGYFWAMVIFRDESKIPLQVLLKKLVVEMQVNEDLVQYADVQTFSQETIIYATIVISVIPIVLVYPYIQKYFIKGLMIGAVKG